MEIILTEKIEKLGDVGQTVNVKNGFARNYLIPQNKALRATEENKKYFEEQKKEILAKNQKLQDEAQKVYDKINGKSVIIVKQASEEGKLYGSVLPKDIAEKVAEITKEDVKKSQIILDSPIRKIGLYDIKIRVYAGLIAVVQINIAGSEDDAKANLKKAKAAEEAEKEAPVKKAKKKDEDLVEAAAEEQAEVKVEEKSEAEEA